MNEARSEPQGQSPCKLLIVDDEPKITRLLEHYFVGKHYEVRVVHRGEEAVVLARVFQPDVVLLDLLMPGLNGIDTLKQLRELPASPRIIMLSVADDEDVVQGALQLGANFYVCKPVDFSHLEHLVSRFILPTTRHR